MSFLDLPEPEDRRSVSESVPGSVTRHNSEVHRALSRCRLEVGMGLVTCHGAEVLSSRRSDEVPSLGL